MDMKLRVAQHKVGAGLADLRAISQQTDVVRLCKAPALIEAMGQSLKANAVTVAALLYTFLHARLVTLHENSLA
jgi:hypothetical protein